MTVSGSVSMWKTALKGICLKSPYWDHSYLTSPWRVRSTPQAGTKCTLSKAAEGIRLSGADNTRLRGAADLLEGRDAIQRVLNWLEERAHANPKMTNKAQCKVLNLWWDNLPVNKNWVMN